MRQKGFAIIFIIIGILIIVGLVAGKYLLSYLGSNGTRNTLNQVVQKPTPTSSESKYSVTIKQTPTLNNYGFTYNATIKNISLEPYITNFASEGCNFIDDKGNKYEGQLNNNSSFEKAVLPGNSLDFTAKNITIVVSGFGVWSNGLEKCHYDEKGNKVCDDIKALRIVDCTVTVSTDGKSPAGRNPLKVVFPQ